MLPYTALVRSALAGCPGGLVEDTLLGEPAGAVAHRDGKGVGGTGRDRVHVAGQADDDLREEGGVAQLRDDDALYVSTQLVEDVLQEVVGHRARGLDLLQRERDGSGLRSADRSEEHTSELQSLMRTSYAVFCLKKKKQQKKHITYNKKKLTKKIDKTDISVTKIKLQTHFHRHYI